MHRVAEARDVAAGLALTAYGVEGERVPPGVVGGQVGLSFEDGVQELAAVLGHAEEP